MSGGGGRRGRVILDRAAPHVAALRKVIAPAAVQYRADMAAGQKAGIADANVVDDTGFAAWVAMQAFKVIAQSVSGPLTGHSLLAALDA